MILKYLPGSSSSPRAPKISTSMKGVEFEIKNPRLASLLRGSVHVGTEEDAEWGCGLGAGSVVPPSGVVRLLKEPERTPELR